jgi:hypothetical protein
LHAHGLIAKVPRSRRWRVYARRPQADGQRHQAPRGRFPQALRRDRLTEELVCVKQRSDEGRIYDRSSSRPPDFDPRRQRQHESLKGSLRAPATNFLEALLALSWWGLHVFGLGQRPEGRRFASRTKGSGEASRGFRCLRRSDRARTLCLLDMC